MSEAPVSSRANKKDELELKKAWLERTAAQARRAGSVLLYRFVETGITSVSLPDVFFILDRRAGWLEFKVAHNNLKDPIVKYEPGQRRELRDLSASGIFAATVAVSCGMDFVIASAPRVLCNTASAYFNLNSSPSHVKGFIEDNYDALVWMLDVYYGKQ